MASDDTAQAGNSKDLSRQLRRYGPLVAIAVVVIIVGAVVAVSSGGGGDEEADDGGSSGESGYCDGDGYTVQTEWGEPCTLPEGVVPFSVAEDEGIVDEIDWPEACDTETRQAAVPVAYAPECFAPFEGDNGGATDEGVTEDAIKVVVYVTPEDDPILGQLASLFGNDDTNDEYIETVEAFLPYYHDYFETYGREIDLVLYEGTAHMGDAEAARADAAHIAEEIQPFAVLDGPTASEAFPNELASRGILHLGGIGGRETPDYYEEMWPYLLDIDMSTLQKSQHIAEYIGKRLAGQPAEHAGDEDLASQERTFGMVFPEADEAADASAQQFEDALAEHGVEFAVVESFKPEDVQTAAPRIIGRMKSEGVTSILPVGDPATPMFLAQQATDQDYFPEWILGGAPFLDLSAFGRFVHQSAPEQWVNAFGVSFGAVPQDPETAGAAHLFRWYTCSEPPADDTMALSFGASLTTFFAILQGVGPTLTHETFVDAAFHADSTEQGLASVSVSWGPPERGRWDEVDYHGVDDATEIWWDPEAEGPDETGREGKGMYRWVEGGQRYLPGEWPESPPPAFEEEGTITYYEEPPPGEEIPEYPSPCE